jgi:thiaminase/transcriptional activator TenA
VSATLAPSGRLRAVCADDWERLRRHPFVRGLADGTLPADALRFYLEQNLQFLPEYARTLAFGAGRASDLATLRAFATALANVVESEIPQNEELLRQTSARDLGGAEGMAPATLAYTSFLVATAATDGSLAVMAAILPSGWSTDDFDRCAADVDDETMERLASLCAEGARLQLEFWDMAYRLEHWPDVRARHPL